MPEQTATNPQTGEKVVLRNGQWVPMGGAAPAPEAQSQAPARVGFIPGQPDTPTPFEAEDQAAQREERRRAQIKFDQDQAEYLATHNPDGSKKPEAAAAAGQASEGERNNKAYYERALRALEVYDGKNMGPRSAVGEGIAAVPGGQTVLRLLPDWAGDSTDRQNSEQAKRDFATIILRSDSGANAPEAEVERLVSTYFPSAGETDKTVLANYAAARMAALEGIKQKAGRLATGLPAYTLPEAAADATGTGSGEEWTREKSIALHGREYVGEDGLPLGPDGGYAKDVETGEWALTGVRVTDDSPQGMVPASSIGPDGRPRITGNDPGYMQIAAGLGDVVQGGLNNTIGLLANPVNTNLFRSLGYDGYTSDIGATAREGLGLPYGNETIGTIGQAGAGGLSGAGLARGASNLFGQGLARASLAEYGATPMLDMVTGASAAGSGELAHQAGAGPVVQTLATLAGGAAPTALAKPGSLASLFTMSPRTPPDFDPSVVQAGQRQNVPIRMGDAVPSTRGEVANLETTARGGPVIQQGRRADNDRIEQRVAEIGGEGNPSDQFSLGTQVQGAGERYITRTRGEKNARYRRAEQLAGDARVTPQRAIGEVDRQIAELEAQGANNNAATIGYLRGLRDDLGKADGFSITEFQGLRSGAGKKIRGDQALTVTDADRRLGEVMREFSADASEQLPEAAASALQDADKFYGQRQTFINGVLKNLMGTNGRPLPAETAAQRLVAMTKGKGDFNRFSQMWGELNPEEQSDVAATVALSLGRKANGDFSPATLIGSLDPRTGINPRTARLLFGEDGAKALDDLRVIAQAKTGQAAQLNNSRTGNMVNRTVGGLKTLVTSLIGYSAGGATGAVALPMARSFFSQWGEEKAARALMNPDFTRWLRNAPDTSNPAALNAYFKRLEIAAAKSPILAHDIQGFREAVNDTLAQSPGSLAAAEQEQN
jgi:hypothetical protein